MSSPATPSRRDRSRQDVDRRVPEADQPGSLLAILQEFAARAINLTNLHSRPTKRGLGDYCFLIDLEGHVADELVADCLRELKSKQADVKFLGSYPAAGATVRGGGEMRRRLGGRPTSGSPFAVKSHPGDSGGRAVWRRGHGSNPSWASRRTQCLMTTHVSFDRGLVHDITPVVGSRGLAQRTACAYGPCVRWTSRP